MTDRQLFETYRRDVFRICYYILHDYPEAEDVCQ
ncbi:MAG: hypothetical protein K0Q73_8028, partial [Paenibacillus sp.]|nr:hypothetical protein [Paenibacillus sp.]